MSVSFSSRIGLWAAVMLVGWTAPLPAVQPLAPGHEGSVPSLTRQTGNFSAPGSDRTPSNSRNANLVAYRVMDGGLAQKWQAVKNDIRADEEIIARCRLDLAQCPPHAARFLSIVEAARLRTGRALLGELNRAINLAIRPVSDEFRHGALDVWSSPLATFAAGTGDCEDYAIAKYVALRHAGFDAADMRLSIVHDTARRVDHAVLTVRVDGRWLVLDNRRFLLVEEGSIASYAPLFTLDERAITGYSQSPPATASLPDRTSSVR